MKLKRLKPRISAAQVGRLAPIVQPRMTGRRLVERNRAFLADHPVCAACHERPSTEVDHQVPLHLGGIDGQPNLQALCGPCHQVKTSAEQVARGSTKSS